MKSGNRGSENGKRYGMTYENVNIVTISKTKISFVRVLTRCNEETLRRIKFKMYKL